MYVSAGESAGGRWVSGFVEGTDRSQGTLFPAQLEDYVAEDNPVRAVDAFVEGLDLGKLGFGRVEPLSGKNDAPSFDRGAPLRHDQVLDGCDALSDETAAEGCNRDGTQCARLDDEPRSHFWT